MSEFYHRLKEAQVWPRLSVACRRASNPTWSQIGNRSGSGYSCYTLGLQLLIVNASSEHELDAAFATLVLITLRLTLQAPCIFVPLARRRLPVKTGSWFTVRRALYLQHS